jgi:hypothetical protein
VVEERLEEREGEDKREEEIEFNDTLEGRASISTKTSSQSIRHSSKASMVNQDSTLRLPTFHGMGRDNEKQHWFTCEAIWSVKRVRDEASKIAHLETTFRERAMMWYMK